MKAIPVASARRQTEGREDRSIFVVTPVLSAGMGGRKTPLKSPLVQGGTKFSPPCEALKGEIKRGWLLPLAKRLRGRSRGGCWLEHDLHFLSAGARKFRIAKPGSSGFSLMEVLVG